MPSQLQPPAKQAIDPLLQGDPIVQHIVMQVVDIVTSASFCVGDGIMFSLSHKIEFNEIIALSFH